MHMQQTYGICMWSHAHAADVWDMHENAGAVLTTPLPRAQRTPDPQGLHSAAYDTADRCPRLPAQCGSQDRVTARSSDLQSYSGRCEASSRHPRHPMHLNRFVKQIQHDGVELRFRHRVRRAVSRTRHGLAQAIGVVQAGVLNGGLMMKEMGTHRSAAGVGRLK